jgi:hypothetical protein
MSDQMGNQEPNVHEGNSQSSEPENTALSASGNGTDKKPFSVRMYSWLSEHEEKRAKEDYFRAEELVRKTTLHTEKSLRESRLALRHESIVGNIVAPAEGEIPIRQYHLAKYRYYPRLMFADGRLELTNKRIIYRVSGVSLFGPILYHNEYEMDHASGLNIESGRRVSRPRFILTLLFLGPALYLITDMIVVLFLSLIMMFTSDFPFFIWVLLFVGLFAVFFIAGEKKFLKLLLSQAALTVAVNATGFSEIYNTELPKGFWPATKYFFSFLGSLGPMLLFLLLGIVFAVFGCYSFSMRKNISVMILSSHAAGTPIELSNSKSFLLHASTLTVFGADANQAVTEVGAIISDLHSMGDAAVEKWTHISSSDWSLRNRNYREKIFSDVARDEKKEGIIHKTLRSRAEKELESEEKDPQADIREIVENTLDSGPKE